MLDNVWIIPAIPAVSFVIILLFGKRLPFKGAEVGIAAISASFILACVVAMLVWGAVLPLVYSSFGKTYGNFIKNNPMLSQFSQFGGGDLFSLAGAMAHALIHPFAIAVIGIIAVGVPLLSIVAERQRGAREPWLGRGAGLAGDAHQPQGAQQRRP